MVSSLLALLLLGPLTLAAQPVVSDSAVSGLEPIGLDSPLPWDPGLVRSGEGTGAVFLSRAHAPGSGECSILLRLDHGRDPGLDRSGNAGWEREARAVALECWGERVRARVPGVAPRLKIEPQRTRSTLVMTVRVDRAMDTLDAIVSVLERPVPTPDDADEAARRLADRERRSADPGVLARTMWTSSLADRIGTAPRTGESGPGAFAGVSAPAVGRAARALAGSPYTVVVVGDIDPARMDHALRERFGGTPQRRAVRPGPMLEDPRTPGGGDEGPWFGVGFHPELESEEVALVSIRGAQPPINTARSLRAYLVRSAAMLALESVAREMLGRAGVDDGLVAGVDTVLPWGGGISQLVSRGEPGRWRERLGALSGALDRVRTLGLEDRHAGEAIAALEARFEDVLEGGWDVDSASLARWIGLNNAQGWVWMEAATELELARRIILQIDAASLNEALETCYPVGEELVIVSTNAPLDERDARDAMARPDRDAGVRTERGRFTLPARGEPDRAVEIGVHAGSGVWTARMVGGAVVHVKPIEGAAQVAVRVGLGRGRIDGLAPARLLGGWLERPTWRGVDPRGLSSRLALLETETNAGVEDGLSWVEFLTSADAAPGVFDLVRAMLSDPDVSGVGRDRAAPDATEIGTARMNAWILRAGDAEGAGHEETILGWIRSAPVEIAVSGDVDPAEMIALAERALGDSIGARPAPAPRRTAARAGGDLGLWIGAPGGEAWGAVGFFTCDPEMIEDVHRLAIGGVILDRRVQDEASRRGLESWVSTRYDSTRAVPGGSRMVVTFAGPPGETDEMVRVVRDQLRALSSGVVPASEFDGVMLEIDLWLQKAVESPSFWADKLAGLALTGRDLDQIVGVLDRHRGVTAEQIREVMSRYSTAGDRIEVLVQPRSE